MEFPIERRRQAGGVLPVLVALVLLVAAGGANYYRHLEAEPPRPYGHYADAELEHLVNAYAEEVDQLARKLPPARAGERRGTRHSLSERVADFEAVQRNGERYREASTQLAGQEGVLREMRKELDRRKGGPWAIHVRRLTTL